MFLKYGFIYLYTYIWCSHISSFIAVKKTLPGTVNGPCLRHKFLHACCVLTRPLNIYSHRGSFTLSGTNATNAPCLSSHSPLPPRQQNTILFSLCAAFWNACMPWRSRLGRESSLPIYLWLFPRLSG